MKKSFLMIAPAATAVVLALGMTFTFAGCANETLKSEVEEEQVPISFESYADPLTRAENSGANYSWNLENHHSTFKVWGYKNTSATAVFSGVTCTYNTTTKVWGYDEPRYWDKAATTYNFYAASPAGASWSFNGVTSKDNQNAGYFKLSNHTVSTANATIASSDSAYKYIQSFNTAASGADLMIAAPKSVGSTQFSQKVQLQFIHILSRLNIQAKKDASIENERVILESVKVMLLNTKGDFDESTEATALASGTNDRWSNQGTPDTYSSLTNVTLDTDAQYVLQSLVLPQEAERETIKLDGSSDETKPYLEIKYTLGKSGKEEEFIVYYNLASVFASTGNLAFNEGWQNNLTINIKPDVIEFDATVAEWSNQNAYQNLDVK